MSSMSKKPLKSKKSVVSEFELIFQTDGTLLIPADVPASVIAVFKSMVEDAAQLDVFLEITQSEVIYGNSILCG